MKKQNSKYLLNAALVLAFSNSVFAFESVTQYQYDSRGRLTKVSDNTNKEVSYTYDDAGNRVNVKDAGTAPIPDPVITQFTAPSSVSSAGAYATITWSSTGASHCALATFGDYSNYPNLPVNGSQSVRIYENTAVTVTCYQGTKSDSEGKLIRVSGGGGPNQN